MKKRTWIIGALILVALVIVATATRNLWSPEGAVAQGPRGAPGGSRPIPVDVGTAVQKPVPLRIDALGIVTPIASVAIKSRLETAIVGVHFEDGAYVKEGDLLFTLDGRALEAQIRQAEGIVARDRAQLEGAERDVRRYTELVAKNASPVTNLDTARTQAQTFAANLKADEAALDNLKVQLSYCTIRAPINGRISAAAVKIGNFVRPSDTSPIATINQIAPIYVTFAVPQRSLPEVRDSAAEGGGTVEAFVPGESKHAAGRVTMIDNTVDTATGMVAIRATMGNKDEVLWPGTLVNTQLTLRVEEAVTVPAAAVQVGQAGNYVFVVKDQVASVRPVTVARTVDNEAVIAKGLANGETIVVDGQLLLSNGSRVAPRERKAQGS
jgi:RND family efflux transporter MFP subunit